MRALRDPQSGCPWDIEQNFSTISPYTVEEAYEVMDAIEREDMTDLKDELGDLLFQVVFHAQMAEEKGLFKFDDVVGAITDKLLRRHPHVFANEQVRNREQLATRWEAHKQDERRQKNPDQSVLDGITANLPALRWSQKIQKRATSVGFDWPDLNPVFEKLDEEIAELKEELGRESNHDRVLDEYGDVLFVCVNIAMHLGLNAEQALRFANNKFISRFKMMEELIKGDSASFDALTLDEMEGYWQQAKENLKS